GRKRSLQGLPPIEGQHAFAGVTVELDIDARKPDGPANHVGLRLERETAKAATRRGLLPGPAQRVAQGPSIGGKRALHFERGPMADVAVECDLERCTGEPDLEARSVSLQRGNEIGETDRGVDWLVVPRQSTGGGQA